MEQSYNLQHEGTERRRASDSEANEIEKEKERGNAQRGKSQGTSVGDGRPDYYDGIPQRLPGAESVYVGSLGTQRTEQVPRKMNPS